MADISNAFVVPNGLSINDVLGIFQGSGDPTSGEVAPVGSLYLRSNGEVYCKTGSGNTEWTKMVLQGDVFVPTVYNVTFANPTTTIDFSQGNIFTLTLTNDTQLNYSNLYAGLNALLYIFQDSTGGWDVTFASSKFQAPSSRVPAIATGINELTIYALSSYNTSRVQILPNFAFGDI